MKRQESDKALWTVYENQMPFSNGPSPLSLDRPTRMVAVSFRRPLRTLSSVDLPQLGGPSSNVRRPCGTGSALERPAMSALPRTLCKLADLLSVDLSPVHAFMQCSDPGSPVSARH